MPRPPFASSFQLLEINLISAQDLYPASKSMRTFAVAWVNPKRKLTTRVDQNGHTNPTWNEKFVFRVDDEFLKDDTSKIMIEIYASAWLRDVLIGTAAMVVNNLQNKSKMRFMAIQLRRPSGRPQGILNIGLGLLDNTMRSMPLYSELSSSAVGYWDLIEGKGANHNQKNHDLNYKDQDKFIIFQRSQSDRTGSDYGFSKSRPASSISDGLSKSRASSSICNAATGGLAKTTKPQGSFCNNSIVNGSELSSAQKGGKVGSICSDVGPSPSVVAAAIAKGIYPPGHGGGNVVRHVAQGDARNSLLDEWTDQDSVEGLKTKIERWRTELPPVYDCKNNNNNNNKSSQHPKLLQSSHHRTNKPPKSRRSRSSGGSLFSCFALGCELSISCGGRSKKPKKKSSGKVHLGTSDMTFDDSSYLR